MKKYLYLLLTVFLSVATLLPVAAQDSDASVMAELGDMEDPLNRPEVWAKLKTDPGDDYLWRMYFGKDLFDLNQNEYALYEALSNHLISQERKEQEIIQQRIHEQKLASIPPNPETLRDDATYQELITNINKNFVIIEVYFQDRFLELGGDYISYFEMYPHGDYNKTQWVDEHENQLNELMVKARAHNRL